MLFNIVIHVPGELTDKYNLKYLKNPVSGRFQKGTRKHNSIILINDSSTIPKSKIRSGQIHIDIINEDESF